MHQSKNFSRQQTIIFMFIVIHLIQTNLFSSSPINFIREVKHKVSAVAQKATDVADDIGDSLEDSAKKVLNKAKAAAKKIDQEFDELGDDVKKALDKIGIKSAGDVLIKAFGKISKKAAKKLAKKLVDIGLFISNDFIRFVAPYEKVLEELFRPLPAVPTGIPLPFPPGTPPGLPVAIDTIIGYIPCFVIGRVYSESLACLRAFHSITKNKYFTDSDKRLFLAQKKEANKKYFASELMKPEVVTKKFENLAKTAKKPLEYLMKLLRKIGPDFFNQFETLGNQVEPVPLMSIIPGGAGNLFNGTVFCFKINNQRSRLDSLLWQFKNSFQPAPKKVFVSIDKLKKNVLMGPLLKIVEKNPIKNIEAIREMNECIVDHLESIPWWTHGYIILFLKILNTAKGCVNAAEAAVIDAVLEAGTLGLAAPLIGPFESIATKVINAEFLFSFIDTLFVWSFTRYLDNRLNHLEELMKQAQADGFVFDGALFETEFQKILSGEEASYPLQDQAKAIKTEEKITPKETAPQQNILKAPETPAQPIAETEISQVKPENSEHQLQSKAPEEPTQATQKNVEKQDTPERTSSSTTPQEKITQITSENNRNQAQPEAENSLTTQTKTPHQSDQKKRSTKHKNKASKKKYKQKRKRKQARKKLMAIKKRKKHRQNRKKLNKITSKFGNELFLVGQ